MNQEKPSKRFHSPSHSVALANPDWRPWVYQTYASSSRNQDISGLAQYHEPAPPPYTVDGSSIQSPVHGALHQNPSTRLPGTNRAHREHALHENPRYQPEQNQYVENQNWNLHVAQLSTPNAYPPSTLSTSSDEDANLSQALDFLLHTSPAPFQTASLTQPIAIPQTMHGRGQSFLRAWAPCLQLFNISQADFLAFIDNLNVVSTASPPLQVLNLVGGFLGMVPHHWAQLAGTAVQASARLGTAVVSKSRTDMYMKEVNEKMFKPRGLRVSIASVDAMRSILRIPNTQPLLAPLTPETVRISTVERELLAVRVYNAVLELDVPRPVEQTTVLAKLSARQVEALAKKNQKKAVTDREKVLEKQEKAGRREEKSRDKSRDKRESKDEKRRARKERREEKKDRKRNKKHDKGQRTDSESSDDESDSSSADGIRKHEKKSKQSKEEKNAGKVLWIVIENL